MQGVVYSLLRLTTYIRRIRVELAQLCTKFNSVVLNFEPLDARSFPLGKVCVRARSKFKIVIFCALVLARSSNQSQILGNTRRTFNVYVMNMFEYVRICSNI